MRVSGGDLCAAEAPIEPAGETKDASKFGAQSEGRDLISGSLICAARYDAVGSTVHAYGKNAMIIAKREALGGAEKY